jgi:hypothetical protein
MKHLAILVGAALLSLVIACNHRPAATTPTAAPAVAAVPSTHFVFAKVMDPVSPLERASKYEDPLDQALQEKKLGGVTGGGTSMAKDGGIEWVGIDLDLVDLEGAVEFSRAKLRDLGAPEGSVLEYQADGKKVRVPIHED